MKAELRYLHSPDVDDLRVYAPGTENFGVFVQAMIGIAGREGHESFGFTVCNPTWLASQVVAKQEGFEWSRAILVLDHYDFTKLETAVRELCSRSENSDWKSIAGFLSRYTLWEFEDYQPTSQHGDRMRA
jgi:hypothetical protein